MGFTFMFTLKDGWMDGEGMKLWLEKVWSKCPGSLLKKTSLIVCDQFKAHVTESTKRLATKLNRSRDLCMRNGQSGLRHQLVTLH
jgi:hypothetical protein